MISLLRILEEWTVHQDYVWFVVVLAWGGVLYSLLWLARDQPDREARWAMAVLAMAGGLDAGFELVLGWCNAGEAFVAAVDFLDGLSGAIWVASLAELALGAGTKPGAVVLPARRRWRGQATVGAMAMCAWGLGIVRFFHPVAGGALLVICAGAVALGLARQLQSGRVLPRMPPRARMWFAAGLFACIAAIGAAALESQVNWLLEGSFQMPRFTLFAAPCQLLTAALFCHAWLEYGLQGQPAESYLRTPAFRAELQVARWVLAGWLVAGLALTVGMSRGARRHFETQRLRRVEAAAALIDRAALRETLGPGLRLASSPALDRSRDHANLPSSVGSANRRPWESLRTQLRAIEVVNPDVRSCRILTLREGWLIVSATADDPAEKDRSMVIIRPARPEDLAELVARNPVLESARRNAGEGRVVARVPLVDPRSGTALGWLSLEYATEGWWANFWPVRFPALAFVALGVALGALVWVHRLRTLERARALERTELEAHANRARSAFLSQVSHELRAPLQALLGFVELLALAPLAEPHRSRAGALRTQGALLLRLVNDLLDLGAIQSGVFRLSCGPTDLRRVMAESIDPLRPRAERCGLELWSEVDAALPAWIETDGARLRQVIFNLVGNAIKYTERSRIGAVLRAALRPGHEPELELRVTDTGPGLPREKQSGGMAPHARLDHRAEAEGLGLGLSLAQSICHALGGTLEVENDGLNGATFVARWPLQPCAAPPGIVAVQPAAPPVDPNAATANRATPLTGLRVLVADDNTAVREMLGAFLHDQGCLVGLTANGREALTQALTGGHDAMLLDLSMPQLDGCAVAQALRRDEPPGRHLLVVGLSARAQAADYERALAAGMDGFMPKPVELAQLAALLARLRHAMTVAPAAWQMPAPLRRQLCALFVGEWPELRLALQAARDAGDRAALQDRAHYLKNSADVLGDDELRGLCLRLQDATQAGNDATAHALVGAIERAGARLARAAQIAAHLLPPDSADGFSPDRP
ncbi:MAG TPA: response regulator [Opitutaceae bacterium]|nr:response regulator [Opitutaceae bacterium]